MVAGRTRLRPVLLTAVTAILGLLPLAIGLNFNFFTLFSELDPHIHMGGDNVVFWGPLSWAVIYGLVFATFLTLIMVPVMLLIVMKIKHRRQWKRQAIGTPWGAIEGCANGCIERHEGVRGRRNARHDCMTMLQIGDRDASRSAPQSIAPQKERPGTPWGTGPSQQGGFTSGRRGIQWTPSDLVAG